MDRIAGTVARLVSAKGFGFVRDASGNEFFFHRSAVTRGQFDRFQPGQSVTFTVEPNAPKGPRCADVQVTL